jgi:predicted NUDIX family phosphoesterase
MTNTTNLKWEEEILVAPRKDVFIDEQLVFQGVEQNQEKVDAIVTNLANSIETMRRGALNDPTIKENNAEINTDYKQPIPYALIKRGDEVFVYARLSGGGETRLHDKLSIGAGGHMNLEEANSFNEVLMLNLERELEEELDIQAKTKELKFIGLINDDENEVGRVHLGILAIIELPLDSEVTVRETEQLRGFWSTVEELKQPETYKRLESWSQFAIDII